VKLTVVSPIKAFLSSYTQEELSSLRDKLTYTNTSIKHLIKRHYSNHFWKSRNEESWQAHLDGLRVQLKKCLVFEENGQFYIRPGSIPYLTAFDTQVENQIEYPKPKKMGWKRPFNVTLYPYQEESWTKLLQEKHGNVSLTTGAGKSLILLKLARELGLDTCVVVPSKSIFEELLDQFEHYLGKGNIGALGDGKRRLGKKITIAIADSLVNLKEGTGEYKFFSELDVFLADESHTLPSETLEAVCHGVLANVKYRFFLSATQLRNDGSTPLLQSIIGKEVCSLTTKEAVEGGYICPHDFKIVSIESSNPDFESSDALLMKRNHFLNNKNIASFSAKLANAMAGQNKGTLILVEELSQISMLAPMLTVPYAIAHSEKRKERLEFLGLGKVDNKESVEKFNKGEVKVLIGTSCIATGTNIFPCHNVINWVGGSSPIKTKQGAVGRSVRHGRSNPWAAKCLEKNSCTIWDFDIDDNFVMSRHLESRLSCYKESGDGLIKYVRLKT
jgi:superfamily II DNA or RNA helicase